MQLMLRGALAATVAFAALTVAALAEDGVTADTITFGQAAVLEGPASALGLGMQMGLNAAFDEINAKGGVHGRKIKLTSVNDGYEPDRAIAATKKLIEEDKVFALVDRHRREGAVHGRVHRCGLPAQQQARQRHQCAGEL